MSQKDRLRVLLCLVCCILSFRTASLAQAEKTSLRVVFMEPVSTQTKDSLPTYRMITDANRIKEYREWIDNDAVGWAFDLYERTWKIKYQGTPAIATNPVYYIGVVPDGNHAKVGFQLIDPSGKQTFEHSTYIELDPDERVFKTTLLHETGHMILAILNESKEIPKREMAPIPHTTAALTDRGTAFDEGFAIHLETLAAHFLEDAIFQERYDHRKFSFGVPSMLGEYHRLAGDLLSYSQTRTRYTDVRDNHFAFTSAFKGPDYFRVQLEKTRDFSELRNANQLLQSEGFYASFFFSYLVRGDFVSRETVSQRQTKLLETLAATLKGGTLNAETPFLIQIVKESLNLYPEESKETVDVLLDLSHGVFVDPNAAKLWHDHYIGSLHFDMSEAKNQAIENARNQWRNEVSKNPNVLYSLLGPQLRMEVPEVSILLISFEEPSPLSFDANTVQEGILKMIPSISDAEIRMWMDQRNAKPFADFDDFKKRCPLSDKALSSLQF